MHRSHRDSHRNRYQSRKEHTQFPDLLEDDTNYNDRYRKPSKLGALSRSPHESPHKSSHKSPLSKKSQKTARELKREKLVREIHNFDKAQIAASLPDPEEEKRKAREAATEQKMRKAVRDILDDMMQTIVVEVSLKLGGAMHAQQNAIKNIVDQYLGNNPVVNDRVDNLEEKLSNSIQNEIKSLLPDVISKIQRDMSDRMDRNINDRIERAERNTNEKLEQFQNDINKQITTISQIENQIENVSSSLKKSVSDLKTEISSQNKITDTRIKEIQDSIDLKDTERKNLDRQEAQSSLESTKKREKEFDGKISALRSDLEDLKVTATEELKTLELKCAHQEQILQKTIESVAKKGKKR